MSKQLEISHSMRNWKYHHTQYEPQRASLAREMLTKQIHSGFAIPCIGLRSNVWSPHGAILHQPTKQQSLHHEKKRK